MFKNLHTMSAVMLASAVCTATPAFAAEIQTRTIRVYHEPAPVPAPIIIDHTDPVFREAHPIRVYLTLTNNKSPDGVLRFNGRAYRELAAHLPAHIIPVTEPRYADMHLTVTLTDNDLYFRTVDTDRKDKKYKKSRRYVGGRCGHLQKAYYTKVEEEGVAQTEVHIKTRLKGARANVETLQLSTSERYSYGTNLTASSNCGMVSTQYMPSNGVAELFDKASPEYRDRIATEIQRETADKLGLVLAQYVTVQSEDYYVSLAYKMTQRMSHPYRAVSSSQRPSPRRYWADGPSIR